MAQDSTLPVTQSTVDYEAMYGEMYPDQKGASPNKALSEFEKQFDEWYPEEQKPEEPGLVEKGIRTLTGTLVDDPIPTTRMATTITGGVTGGIIGSRVPPAPGHLGLFINPFTAGSLFSALGVTAGVVAPEYTMELAESMGIVNSGFRDKHGLPPDELKMLVEGEIVLDLVTGGTFTVGQLAGRKLAQKLSGVTKESLKLSEKLAAKGQHLMPVHFGGKTIAKGHVAVLGRFPFIGSVIRERGQEVATKLSSTIRNIPSRIAPLRGFNEISEKIFTDGTTLFREMSKKFSKQYDEVFKEAEIAGVVVKPEITIARAKNIIQRITDLSPTQMKENPSAGKVLEIVKKFLDDDILTLEGKVKDYKVFDKISANSSPQEINKAFTEFSKGKVAVAGQSLRQMDGLLGKIDQELASFEPGQKKYAMKLLQELKLAGKMDVISNLRGEGAEEIAKRFLKIDKDFSHTMASVFETATAKRFGTVTSKGLKGMTFDEATRQNVDKVAKFVIDLESPQSIEELSRLLKPETFKEVTAEVLNTAIRKSIKKLDNGATAIDADAFIKGLAINMPTSPKHKVIKKMLEKSGNALSMADLGEIAKAAILVSRTEIPDVSSFITRRITLGGARSLITTFLPGMAAAGGAAAVPGMRTLVGGLMFLGGTRTVSKIISDPRNARLLRSVINSEATDVVRRKAWTQLIRLGASVSFSEEDSIYRDEGVPKVDFDDQGNAFSIDWAKKQMKQAGEEFIEAVESMTIANEE